jgi:two-component system chemotaxis response regulator CheB
MASGARHEYEHEHEQRHDAARLAAIELVVIGASAGAVEALGALLAALPAACRVALVVVLHLSPQRSSGLPALFAARCALPLRELEDKEPVAGGTVYFAAPDYHVLFESERSFALSQDAAVNFSRPSIDVALESAALAYGAAALGVILSGASADGAAGLAALRAAGGLAWVLDPARAAFRTMPDAALRLAGADAVLGIEQIAAGLARLGNPTCATTGANAR